VSRPRDLHPRIRAAIAATLAAAAAGGDVGLLGPDEKPIAVKEQDELNLDLLDKPVIVCFYTGAELPRGGSNGRDDLAYPVSVGLFATGPANAAAAEKPNLTAFLAALSGLFHKRRLAGVGEVLFCEVNPESPVIIEKDKFFDQLRAGRAVTAVTRTGRG
jgi:hypothetical protein